MSQKEQSKSKTGLQKLYIAEVLQDDAALYSAGTPEWLAPAAEAAQTPTTSSSTQYADDAPFEQLEAEAETKVDLTITGISLEMLAKITGKTFDATTGRIYDHKGTAPYFALSFRSKKSNGKYRYYQYLKGKFSVPGEEHATETDKPDPKTVKLTYTAIFSEHVFNLGAKSETAKKVVGDEDADAFSGATWFSTVQVPGVASVEPLALSSSVPVDDATGVSRSADITLTFNNALVVASLSNILLLDNNSAVVTCAKSLDSTKKIATLNPDTDLAASTAHTIVIGGVKDIYGQTLTTIVTFTTGT